ncbi:endonuclease exonuclease phosphatase domain-containing protein [Cyclospora cayetanensis]|uniref:Endonuclease exonuclease phosphatase domain-containing protein n=1 Tax=Cyclospora cayetanensis TaxID=88456 RepID=A0A1D3CSV6_9EIME|nr:endonuclease exonuclease phosphatase domain-containing protein [Cyclospora cayetanensis]
MEEPTSVGKFNPSPSAHCCTSGISETQATRVEQPVHATATIVPQCSDASDSSKRCYNNGRKMKNNDLATDRTSSTDPMFHGGPLHELPAPCIPLRPDTGMTISLDEGPLDTRAESLRTEAASSPNKSENVEMQARDSSPPNRVCKGGGQETTLDLEENKEKCRSAISARRVHPLTSCASSMSVNNKGENTALPEAQDAPSGAESSPMNGGVLPASREDKGTSERLEELSVLSFNAGLLEYKLCGLRIYQNPPFTQRRLHHIPGSQDKHSPCLHGVACFITALLSTGADIICLQEVYGENHADFIIENTRHKLPFVGRRTSGGRFSLHNGLMVLSKYPIVHTHFHRFENVTYIERCFASKGMLEVAVDVPSIGVIAVFNIHLASGAVDPESRYVEDVRAAEIRQLLKACDAAADRGHVPLVIGDLNAGSTELQQPLQRPSRALQGSSTPAAIHRPNPYVRMPLSPHRATVASDADCSDMEREQEIQLLEHQQAQEATSSSGKRGCTSESPECVNSSLRRNSNFFVGANKDYLSCPHVEDGETPKRSNSLRQSGSVELTSRIFHNATVSVATRHSLQRSNTVLIGRPKRDKDDNQPVKGILGGFLSRAGGSVQHPLAFELPAAAAWAHREFFLTAKRRLIEQQRKWLGGGDKAPVLDVRLSLSAPQSHQQGVDATPLASDCSLGSCSTALSAAQNGDSTLLNTAAWETGGRVHAVPWCQWHNDEADDCVTDWLLSDIDDENDSREESDVVIAITPDGDTPVPCSRRDFTWDPGNPLNTIGPHAGCHGLRCDYIFLPPHQFAGGLYPFLPVAADILMRDPRVLVDACCFGCFGEVMLVTLSDHYAVRVTLRRSTDRDIADFWGSCAAEATTRRPPAA